jgi:hypothetical protein
MRLAHNAWNEKKNVAGGGKCVVELNALFENWNSENKLKKKK